MDMEQAEFELDLANDFQAACVRFQHVLKERDDARAELATMTQAVGLATTLKPSMTMRPDDPIGMMQEVAEEVAELARARKWRDPKEERPEEGASVILRYRDGSLHNARCTPFVWFVDGVGTYNSDVARMASGWLPLPPAEGEGKDAGKESGECQK